MKHIDYHVHVTCPYCGVDHVAYSDTEGEDKRPRNGDVSICSKCAGVARYRIYQSDIKLEKTNDAAIRNAFSIEQVAQIHSIRQQILKHNDPRQFSN